jgi:hypothetical protein
MKCSCGYNGKFDELGNDNSVHLGIFYILRPDMQSKYEGIVHLYACPECKTVKALAKEDLEENDFNLEQDGEVEENDLEQDGEEGPK